MVKGFVWGVSAIVLLLGCVASAEEVTCESRENRHTECGIHTSDGVRLVRQLSSSPCVEGRTWGVSGDSVWVDDGCRAVFASKSGEPAGGLVEVTCESRDNRHTDCDIETKDGVRLVRQLSKSPCIEGRTWGVSEDSVWVDDGCRATFAATGGTSTATPDPRPARAAEITCESKDRRRTECAIGGAGGVRLVRQLSNSPCTEGTTWGVLDDSVWVDDGCRAVFAAAVASSLNSSF